MSIAKRFRSGASRATIAAILVAAAGAAQGQEGDLPDAGDFELTVSLVSTDDPDAVGIGVARMAQAVNQTVHLFNPAGTDAFLNYAVGNCVTFQVVDVAENTVEMNGYCNYRDADGDVAFERFATDGAVPLDAIVAEGEFIGGTGKYETLTGTTETELFATVENREANLVGGTKVGTFELAEAAAAADEPAAEPVMGGEPEEDGAVEPVGDDEADAEPEAAPEAEPEPEPEEAAAGEDDEGDDIAAMIAEGEGHYQDNCAACHGAEGGGGAGPTLAGNNYLQSTRSTIGQILAGNPGRGMPGFADVLNDEEIAAIATYIRNSWGNEFGPVAADTVATYR